VPEPEACPCCMHGAQSREQEHASEPTRRAVLQAGAVMGAALAIPPVLRSRPAMRPRRRALRTALPPRTDWPVPAITTRAQWGADESLRIAKETTTPPDYDSVVNKLIVHHTASPNDPPDPAAAVRSVYDYHVGGVYLDVAYNWLIDQHGVIYEGRWARDYPDGVAHSGELEDGRQVRGGHAANTNAQSCGIALLGTFTNQAPTDAALEALVTVLAWKCARWGIDPNGKDVYAPDGRTFANICGHRDTSSTSCPGDALEQLLPDLRARVADRLARGTSGLRKVATGYWITSSAGAAVAIGDAPKLNDLSKLPTKSAVRSIVAGPNGSGYWMLGADGGVFSFGSVQFYGSTGATRLNRPVIAMAPTPSGAGYWLCSSDGGIFAFGDGGFFGSTGAMRLNRPIVGMASTPSGNGYWLVASDGGIFAFGDAGFFGSTGAIALNQPIVDMAATPSGLGYWLLARDGGIFAFGDAPFKGSAVGRLPDAVGLAVHTVFAS